MKSRPSTWPHSLPFILYIGSVRVLTDSKVLPPGLQQQTYFSLFAHTYTHTQSERGPA